ncbi:hypothetical protein [Nonomuraea purpurea]|uniref:hypothetical protein n=1 Tax=Nonomuraea purpurea TaxID=1849276 RepID=UPI0036D222E8
MSPARADALTDVPVGAGQIPGLRPRRNPGDGGEVPGADVDLIDGLDPQARRAVDAWLRERPSTAARQLGLQAMASFLRWLSVAEPDVAPLAATGTHVDAYCQAALTGGLTVGVRRPGRPLAKATVGRRRTALASFYAFVWRCGALRPRRAGDGMRPLTRQERRLLRQGVAHLAADGRSTEAVAVALLVSCGASVSALAGMTAEDVHAVAGGGIVTLRDSRGDVVAFPVPPLARPFLRAMCRSRSAGEPLLRRGDGQALDLEWVTGALVEAALVAGIPEQRAKVLHPHMMRAPTVSELVHSAP